MSLSRFCRAFGALALTAALLTAIGCESTPADPSSRAALSSTSAKGSSSAKSASSAAEVSSDAATSDASSAALSSKLTSSKVSSAAASSRATSSATASLSSGDYYDVDAAFASSGKSMTADVSACFPASAKGYRINGGTASQPYLVDAATLVRLTSKPVTGSGYVKWEKFALRKEQCGVEKAITGVIPVSKLHDPIYMEMALPSAGEFFWCDFSMDNSGPRRNGSLKWNNRKNGFNMLQPRKDHTNMINMGAFYLNYNEEPPAQNASITICVKDMKMFVHKKGDPATKWTMMSNLAVPTAGRLGNKVAISWSGGNKNIQAKYTNCGDHAELALKGSDLWTGDSDWKDNPNHQFLIHFWDSQINFTKIGISDPSTVDGVVCCYTAWVKEAAMANKLLATVGADLRPGLWPENYEDWQAVQAGTLQKNPYKDSSKDRSYIGDTKWNGQSTNQVMASRGALVPATPTVIFCHNVYGGIYDKVVDTNTVQKLIGLK